MKVNITIGIPAWLDRICAWPVMVYRKHKYGWPFRRIFLGEGEWTILDQKDYYRYSNLRWHLFANGGKYYAVCNIKKDAQRTREIKLHREIMAAPKGLLIDHKNGNSLDSRRDNLRLATRAQNNCNRQKTKSKTSSRFVGPSFDKSRRKGKWNVSISHEGKKIFIGRFDSEVEAARAYDRAAIKYHGEFARLNFPREDYINENCPSNCK